MRYCAEVGCRVLVAHGRCPAHTRSYDRARGSAHARGYGRRWERYAAWWKATYPLCGMRQDGVQHGEHSACVRDDRVTPVYAVDHIAPVSGPTDTRFYDETNHQSLCQSCHAAKSQSEQQQMHHAQRAGMGLENLWDFPSADRAAR